MSYALKVGERYLGGNTLDTATRFKTIGGAKTKRHHVYRTLEKRGDFSTSIEIVESILPHTTGY